MGVLLWGVARHAWCWVWLKNAQHTGGGGGGGVDGWVLLGLLHLQDG